MSYSTYVWPLLKLIEISAFFDKFQLLTNALFRRDAQCLVQRIVSLRGLAQFPSVGGRSALSCWL